MARAPAWLAQRRKYENGGSAQARAGGEANAECRYRDNGLLRYWFRTDDCVNHWLASSWNMVSGRFCPANEKRRGEFLLLDEK